MKLTSRSWLLGLVLFACSLCLPGCGCDGLEGTYADSEDILKIEFRDDERAYVSLGGVSTFSCDYEVDGDRVILKNFQGSDVVFTRKDDGSLDGGVMYGTLKKKDD